MINRYIFTYNPRQLRYTLDINLRSVTHTLLCFRFRLKKHQHQCWHNSSSPHLVTETVNTAEMEPPGPEDVWSDNNNNNNQEETIQATLAEQYPFLHLPQDAPPYLLSSRDFVPRSDLMDRLMSDLGFSETAAKKSLYWTGNHNLDLGPSDRRISSGFLDTYF